MIVGKTQDHDEQEEHKTMQNQEEHQDHNDQEKHKTKMARRNISKHNN
jgi:hypothetical protein